MRVARVLLASALCVTLAGCGRREAQRAGADTTGTAAPRVSPTPAIGYAPDMILHERAGARADAALVGQVRGALAGWAAAWRYQDPAFRLDSLRWHGPDSCRIVFDLPLREAFFDTPEQRGMGWIPSPDGTLELVPDAYREWDPHSATWEHEPDVLAALVDQVNGRWTRLMECGTSCRYDWGAWLDRDRFVIAGALEDGDPQMLAPQVWLFDVRQGLQWRAIGPMAPEGNSRYDDALDSLTAKHARKPA